MNQVQKNYLLKRIQEIANEKKSLIKSNFSEKPPRILRADKVLLNLLKAKITKEKPDTLSRWASVSLGNTEIFEQVPIAKWQKKKDESLKAVEARREVVDQRVTQIKDEIMIGDEKKAMELLSKFEKEVF